MPILNSGAQALSKTDSLKAVLKEQSAEDKYSTLVALAIEYVDKDNKTSYDFIDQAYTQAIALKDTAKIVRSGRIKGQLLRRLDRLEEAVLIYDKLLPVAKRNQLINDYKVILNSLALTYTDKANYDKALEYNFESLIIREAEGNKSEISLSLGNIGLVYYKLNDYEKAIDYYNRSLALKKEANDNYGVDFTMINLGLCYNALHHFDKAQEYISKGLKTCGENCPNYIKTDGELGLGISYYNQQNFDQAKKHFNKSLEIAIESGNKRFQAENLNLLAQIAILEKEYSLATEMLSRAERLSQQTGYNKLLIQTYHLFSSLYKQQSEFEKASYYQDKYIHLKDSIFSDGLIKNLASIQTKFEERENIKTIATHEEELIRQRRFITAIVIIALLASLLVFMLFRSNIARRKANVRLDNEVKAATKDLKAANRLLAEVNKELDLFIYKTSHDIRGPLASLKGLCNVALFDVQDPVALNYFNKLDFTASRLDTLLRRLQKINQINHASPHYESIDFDEIISDLEIMERRKGLPAKLMIRKEIQKDIDFCANKELVSLVLENLMDNAIKFHDNAADAKPFVLVKIGTDDEKLVIRVTDNGVGIGQANPEELFQMFVRASERSVSGGIGLYLSRRATEKLSGEINMRTTAEGYTEFYVTLPLEKVG